MKPITLVIALFMTITSTAISRAQSSKDISLNQGVLLTALTSEYIMTGEIKVTNVNIKAVRDFTRLYRNITDAKWFTTDKGYSVSFYSNGKNTKVEYHSKGWRLYSIISYTEKDLDFSIRDLVKRNYYDSNIIGIQQFEFANNKTLYIIKMMDMQSKVATLKVSEGQIEDITDRR